MLAQEVQTNVRINRQTILDKVFVYLPGTLVEYPETMGEGRVGHLFEMDPSQPWYNPAISFAYSLGEPKGSRGGSSLHNAVYCDLLRDLGGNRVPCRESHATCQGCKACSYADWTVLAIPHCRASRDSIQSRLCSENLTPSAQVLKKTHTFWAALQKNGCGALPAPSPVQSHIHNQPDRLQWQEKWDEQREASRRGHTTKLTCQGRLLFDYDRQDRPFIRDHLVHYGPESGEYDVEYLQALFNEDKEETHVIESEAQRHGFYPASPCPTVINHTSVRVTCRKEHCDENGRLQLGSMVSIPCHSLFRIYQPLQEYRQSCPKILIVCSGLHTHPIPLPTKTPAVIRSQILSLLFEMDYDLPDMTPRRFLRHPNVRKYLQTYFPSMVNPALSDLHISLANRDHLRSYLRQGKKAAFPFGTGWRGLLNLKEIQDRTLPDHQRYIRLAVEVPQTVLSSNHEADNDNSDTPLRVVICILPQNSHRLQAAQYLQSDIGFKRVAGFQEFELSGIDLKSNLTLTYCRIFLTHQSAAAHQFIFRELERIVEVDTGSMLRWRHLHAMNLDDLTGILQWTGDQHGGQAKGLGLHLQWVARRIPDHFDLHEPARLISTLDEYDHLRRVFRLCSVHVYRNIKTANVEESVKSLMRSLICMEHPDVAGTLEKIEQNGGKSGAGECWVDWLELALMLLCTKDWVQDKVRSRFALAGICWAKSFIPRVVWQNGDANSNIVEGLHSDVNSEGLHCSLVCGVKKGLQFDLMKSQSLKIFETAGIRPSYKSGHRIENITRGIKRKDAARRKRLTAQDAKLKSLNARLDKAKASLDRAQLQASRIEGRAVRPGIASSTSLAQAVQSVGRMRTLYSKALQSSLSAIGTGTGRVGLLLPRGLAEQRCRS
ncbi:hypothetical protein HYDPIDRAFT_78824 [Hydnomerulius pinastri MD-312]|nr:hypothetical protein HYDPIDRAFT_78824 [Hydnomerulius pinastri MD-312]